LDDFPGPLLFPLNILHKVMPKIPLAPLPQRLRLLRERLVSAKDFRDPWNYFHDKLVVDRNFMRAGALEPNPDLERVLGAAAQAYFHRQVPTAHFTAIHLAEHAFWHGSGTFDLRQGIFFYFKEIDAGLVAIDSGAKYTAFLRFSLVETVGSGPIFSSSGPRGQG
jgi:hypothetical protein